MLPTPARDYLIAALDHTPVTLAALLCHLSSHDVAWDVRPDTERFSLREIVAHLADWDEVWRWRFETTVREENPLLPRPDPGKRAEERGYAAADPRQSLACFRERRTALTTWLRSLPDEAWARTAQLGNIGEIALESQISLTLAHDAYHSRQIAVWLAEV